MEDKLVTLAILTYAKAQILKNVLENEGIETYIHNVNQIQPVVSSGVRVRIKESDLPYGDVFNYQLSDEENVRNILQKVHSDLNALSDKVKAKVASGEFPDVKYTCVLREGIPEEEILRYSKENRPRIIIMGTRGKNQKDIDLIGSVTAEIIERSRVPVLAIPENTPFKQFSDDFLNSLDNYIKTNQIDIITLTSYKRNIFSRLFNPGIARKMIFHSDTPLLVIYGQP